MDLAEYQSIEGRAVFSEPVEIVVVQIARSFPSKLEIERSRQEEAFCDEYAGGGVEVEEEFGFDVVY
ncbi:hypothetical protein [Halorubellus sp. PRR65]|uniref:hypothetical protein n=1 Tax=Halorubellus sp. PRR65 TaxID=3098148 RepID=UPI002B25E896|nr:hypothetical protein [Halorubellus sp. PRR65]